MFYLEKIFNALVLYHYNMRALHWKIKGLAFDDKHDLAKGYYEKFDDLIDEVAEILLMLDGSPKDLNTIIKSIEQDTTEYLLVSCEKDAYYTEEQMLVSIQKMLEHLLALYTNADKDESIPSDVRSKLEEHMYYFRLECDYKGKNRLIPNQLPVQTAPIVTNTVVR